MLESFTQPLREKEKGRFLETMKYGACEKVEKSPGREGNQNGVEFDNKLKTNSSPERVRIF